MVGRARMGAPLQRNKDNTCRINRRMAATTALSVYHASYGRRCACKFAEHPVDRMAVERMKDAAIWVPNHRLAEPWRFLVVEQERAERIRAAELAAKFQLQRTGDQRRADAAPQKVLEPPVVIYGYSVSRLEDETTKENFASVCIATHNISLAGAAEGLAATWETGDAAGIRGWQNCWVPKNRGR